MSGTRSRLPGELEAEVMRVLWQTTEPITAAQLRAQIEEPRPALTTALTVLDRLRLKGLVARAASPGVAILFTAAVSETAHAARAMTSALDRSSNRGAALLRFAGELDDRDGALLRAALDAGGTP